MKKELSLLLFSALLILSPKSLVAQSVTVKSLLPQRNQVVGDSVLVEATVASQNQLTSVTASVEGRAVALTYDSGKLRGMLILTGLTTGTKTLVVTATDVSTQSASDSVSIIHEPILGIVLFSCPEANTRVPAKVYISAKAVTADTAAHLTVSIDGNPVKQSDNTLADTINLSPYHGRYVHLAVNAYNSLQQYVNVDVPLYVDSTSALVLMSAHKGNILDFNAQYVLSGAAESLWVYDRRTLTERGLALPSPYQLYRYAFLIGDGFVTDAVDYISGHFRIYEWRPSGFTLLADMDLMDFIDFRAAGDYVVWGSGMNPSVFVRKNFLTGDTVTLSTGTRAGNTTHSLAPNGNYAFWTIGDEIYFYDGTLRPITNYSTDEKCVYPSTDGTLIAFRRLHFADYTYSVVLYDGTRKTVLTTESSFDPGPPYDYCAAYGYVAFAKTSALGDINIWVRLPNGSMVQRTFFGNLRRPFIDHLTPDGSLVVVTSGSGAYSPERSVIDSSGFRRVLCSGLGKAARIDGRWYVAMGRSFLRIEDRPVSVDPDLAANGVPFQFHLAQNYPNPFNPTTTISYQLPVASNVRLVVYDLLGRDVAELVNERKAPGSYEVKFEGSHLSSGVYFYRIIAGDFVQTRKLLLLR